MDKQLDRLKTLVKTPELLVVGLLEALHHAGVCADLGFSDTDMFHITAAAAALAAAARRLLAKGAKQNDPA